MRWVRPQGQCNSLNNAAGSIQPPQMTDAGSSPLSATGSAAQLSFPRPWLLHQGTRWARIPTRRTLQQNKPAPAHKWLPQTSAEAVHHSSVPFDRHVNPVPMRVLIQIKAESEGKKKNKIRLRASPPSQLLYSNICHCANLIFLFGWRLCLAGFFPDRRNDMTADTPCSGPAAPAQRRLSWAQTAGSQDGMPRNAHMSHAASYCSLPATSSGTEKKDCPFSGAVFAVTSVPILWLIQPKM